MKTSISLIVGMLLLSISLFAQNNKKETVLFLGNSYTSVNNLPQLIQDLAVANGDTLEFDSNCPGGFTFNQHFNNTTSRSKINAQKWDYVVLQAQSQEPSFPPQQVASETLPYAVKLDSLIRVNDSCTQTLFYETWGRKNGDQVNCPSYPPLCTYNGMQERLKDSYQLFANSCKAIMVPAGEAWKQVMATQPTINLYQSDESHPSIEGSYLVACVFYETIFRKSVVGNTFTANIPTATTTILQQIAHDIFNNNLTDWNIGKYTRCETTTAIQNTENSIKWHLFPNPNSGTFTVTSNSNQNKSFEIYNILGEKVFTQNVATQNFSVQLPQLKNGIYLVKLIQLNGAEYFDRIVIK